MGHYIPQNHSHNRPRSVIDTLTGIFVIMMLTGSHFNVYPQEHADSLATIQMPGITTDSITIIREYMHPSENDTICNPDTIATDIEITESHLYAKKFQLAVKSNLLSDAILVPNIGLEYHIAKRWSIGASVTYAKWKSDRHLRYWCASGLDIFARRYFGRQNNGSLSGHHVGIYAQIGSYDFELGGDGQKSDDATGQESNTDIQ